MAENKNDKAVIGMRDAFFNSLFEIAKNDRNVFIITADNGAPSLDQFFQELPDQIWTVGIAEQQMMGMAAGLAFEGKIVYTYAIAPFVTARVFEFNKLLMGAMGLRIINLGVGAGYAYDIMGPTHHTVEDIAIMRTIPGMYIYSPADGVTAAALAKVTYENPNPQYVRFDRSGIPDLYPEDYKALVNNWGYIDWNDGGRKDKAQITILATGIMVHQAIEVMKKLKPHFSVRLIDIYRIKPITRTDFLEMIRESDLLVTMEEHFLAGGLGSIIAEKMADNGMSIPLLRIGQKEQYIFTLGGREEIWKHSGLDVDSIYNEIVNGTLVIENK